MQETLAYGLHSLLQPQTVNRTVQVKYNKNLPSVEIPSTQSTVDTSIDYNNLVCTVVQ